MTKSAIGRRDGRTSTCAITAAVAITVFAATLPAVAQEVRTFPAKAAYEDVKADLMTAIVNRGLVSDYTGNIGRMLERTGADVGSTRAIYRSAEYLTFCSAKFSRVMMEADPANLGFCPFVMFIYEIADKPANAPGSVVVGYRRPVSTSGNAATQAALANIDKLLSEIATEATR
ncbi:MAG: DUF302 domain-containing protein [Hyphomicrobium sp.]|nr:DUF302 domain-containing protein [Hyphomicrobium sp.]